MLATVAGGAVEPDAYGVEDFCLAHRISRTTFYTMLKAGEAPRIMRVRSRMYISKEAAADWRAQREQAAAA